MAIRLAAVCAPLVALLVAPFVGAGPAYGQQPVTLQFADGLVSLRAQNAPVRAILAEWARLGGSTVVNGDRVAGAPVTLELTNVPESQALDIVLRGVAGYMLGPRRAGMTGASAYDRIMILPTSVAPRNPPPAAAAAAPAPRPVLQRPLLQRPQPPQEQTDGAPDESTAADADEATDDQPGITIVGMPANPFGVPAGSSTTPGVISPAPRQQPAQPNRVQ